MGTILYVLLYFYYEFLEEGHLELYNLETDIGETRNLAGQEPALTSALYELLKHWRKSVNAQMPVDNPA